MRAKPPAPLNSNLAIILANHSIINRLQFFSLVRPYLVNLEIRKLILPEKSYHPSKQLTLVRIVQVVIIIVCIVVVVNTRGNVLNISHTPNLTSCLVEKHLTTVTDHRLPKDLVETTAKLRKNIRVTLLPNTTQSQCSPEHLPIVKSRHSRLKIMSRSQSLSLHSHPRHKTSKSRICFVKFLESLRFLLNKPKHFCNAINLISEFSILQNLGHYGQMNRLLTTCSKSMQSLRQHFSRVDINPNSIKSKPSPRIHAHLLDELRLPSHKPSQKIIQNLPVFQKVRCFEFLSEPTLISIRLNDRKRQNPTNKQQSQQSYS